MSTTGMLAADSSVAVAGFGDWHELHRPAAGGIERRPALPAHAALESYSVLTRLPEPFRAEPDLVIQYIDANFTSAHLTLDPGTQREAPAILQRAGVRGGAVYDGIVALTAMAAEASLLTLDSRAARTYELVGCSYELLG